jgi:hypothetical protein
MVLAQLKIDWYKMNLLLFISISLSIMLNTTLAFSAEVTLRWKPAWNLKAAGYKVFYGIESKTYTEVQDTGKLPWCVLSLDEGNDYYAALTVYDWQGNESAFSDEIHIVFDRTPPDGSIEINGDAESTNIRLVLLKLDAADEESGMERGAMMKLSNDGINWDYEGPYFKYFLWLLPDDEGKQKVYAQYIDAAGNQMDDQVSDSIIYTISSAD